MINVRPYCFGLIFLFLLVDSPAQAYRVFLDHNTDGDLNTFINVVEVLEVAPITIIIELDASDQGLSDVYFVVEWDCVDDPGGCNGVIRRGHVDAVPGLPPTAYPFSNIDELFCLGQGCICSGERTFVGDVDPNAQPGFWAFGTKPFSRLGWNGPECEDVPSQAVEFRVVCPDCNYETGDDPRRRIQMFMEVDLKRDSWSQTKALYSPENEDQ